MGWELTAAYVFSNLATYASNVMSAFGAGAAMATAARRQDESMVGGKLLSEKKFWVAGKNGAR